MVLMHATDAAKGLGESATGPVNGGQRDF